MERRPDKTVDGWRKEHSVIEWDFEAGKLVGKQEYYYGVKEFRGQQRADKERRGIDGYKILDGNYQEGNKDIRN